MSGSQDVLAFCAGIAGEKSTFGEGEKLIFDKVLTNHGDGYDPTCGIFTAPEAGVFVISIETSVSPNGILNLELVVDNEPLAEITVEAPERKMASASRRWVLDLNEDSKVFVRAIKSGEVVGRMHTSFSGWRIGFKSPDAIQEERKEPLYPPQAETIPVEKAMASPSKQKVSVQGKVIREEAIRRVDVRNEKGVAVKDIFIEDSSGECKVALWRTLAEESPRPGDCVIITDLIKNIFRNETSLSSTWTSKITKIY